VPRGAVLEEVVVWDGVDVPEGAHRRAVIHDGGVLKLDQDSDARGP
jgi:hypothetical protein